MGNVEDGQICFDGCDVPRKFNKLVPLADTRDGHLTVALKYMAKANSCYSLYEAMKQENPNHPKKTKIYDINQIKGDADFFSEEGTKEHKKACDLCPHDPCIARNNYSTLQVYLGSAVFRDEFLKDLKTKPNLMCTIGSKAVHQTELFS